jgi:hypothetical protein
MLRIDLSVLAAHVHAVIADPHACLPSTGDTTLDEALADLARRRRSPESQASSNGPLFWLTPVPAHAPCQ